MTRLLLSVAWMAALAGVLATLLVWARRRFRVLEDSRVERLAELLPQTNCGACGFPGCRSFAEALSRGRATPAGCTVSSPAERERIARFLGVVVGAVARRVARLACAGGNDVARRRGRYLGPPTCAAAQSLGGGGKLCAWGCLGFGDCERACRFDAIDMTRHDLPVVDAVRCTACGDCVTACPRDLFRLLPEELPLLVRCSSEERGDLALDACEVACTACGRCAMDAPELVRMGSRSLPVVAYDRPHDDRRAIERCPTGAIVWVEGDRDLKGGVAPRLSRHESLPPEASRVDRGRGASNPPTV